MFGKISRAVQLFKIYKIHAFHLLINPLLGRPIWIPVNGRKFHLNFDNATYYHLIHSTDKVKKLTEAIPNNPEGVIIDGGANHGLFSLYAHLRFPDNKIFAVEPYPKMLPLLRKNLPNPNTVVVAKALAADNGEVTFFTSGNSDQLGSTIRENVQDFGKKTDVVNKTTVTAVSLSSFIRDEKISKIAVLKLDIQGSEFDILKNADDVLAITDFLILEVTFLEKSSLDLIEKAKKFFPYHRAINQIIYGADIILAKQPFD